MLKRNGFLKYANPRRQTARRRKKALQRLITAYPNEESLGPVEATRFEERYKRIATLSPTLAETWFGLREAIRVRLGSILKR